MSEFLARISGYKFIVIIFSRDYLLKLHLCFQLRCIFEAWYGDWFVFIELLLEDIFLELLLFFPLLLFISLIVSLLFVFKLFIEFADHFLFVEFPLVEIRFCSAFDVLLWNLLFGGFVGLVSIVGSLPVESHRALSCFAVVKQHSFFTHLNYYKYEQPSFSLVKLNTQAFFIKLSQLYLVICAALI